MVDRTTSRSRGFGFVTFESDADVDKVLQTENSIMGKWVEVKRAEPRDMKCVQFYAFVHFIPFLLLS